MSTTPTPTCAFCCREEDLLIRAPLTDDPKDPFIDCDRWLHKDQYCIVTLDPAQLSRGHALAILRKHRKDVLDPELTREEHHALVDVVQLMARLMKERLSCDRVYVATLCDGIEHLHYDLIPRYSTDIKGFAFIGQREWSRGSGYWIGPKAPRQRAKYLEAVAKTIRGVSNVGILAYGYRVAWCLDSKLARKLDLEGWEIVVEPGNNSVLSKFRLKDRPADQTLIKKRTA